MIDIINDKLFEQSFANDKENLLKMIGIVLNSEFYEPAFSNPQSPSYIDPLFYDIWPIYQQVMLKLNSDIEVSAGNGLNDDFIRILTNYKINLKNLGKCFENVDSERKMFRKLCIRLLKQILEWKRDGSFNSDDNLEAMSSRMTMRNYEILKKSKERIEDKMQHLEDMNTELILKCGRLEKKNKMLKRVRVFG